MTTLERWALGALLLGMTCAGCGPRYLKHTGIPPQAAATSYCDETGAIRTALDAALFLLRDDGSVGALNTLPEVLAHESAHRAQMEAQRPKPDVCPPDPSWPQLAQMEIEAYCTSYGVALMLGVKPDDVGTRYAGAFLRQFHAWLGPHVQPYIDARWNVLCPGRPLFWDANE